MYHLPALKIAIPFIAGLGATGWIELPQGVVVSVTLLLTVLAFISNRNLFFDMVIFSAIFFAAYGYMQTVQADQPWNDVRHLVEMPVAFGWEGSIDSPVETADDETLFILSADTVWIESQPIPVNGRLQVQLKWAAHKLYYGDHLIFKGTFRHPRSARNPGDFDYRSYLLAKNIQGLVTVWDSTLFIREHKDQSGSVILRKGIYPLRRKMSAFIDDSVGGQEGALVKSLLVASRRDLDESLKSAFARTGVIHVLAVSGLHVGLVLGVILLFLKGIRIPNPYRAVLTVLALGGFAALTGFQPPVCRATLMASLILFGHVMQKKPIVINSLAVAAIILLVINPLQLFQAGFQLSFIAVLGIVLIYPRLQSGLESRILNWQERSKTFWPAVISLFLVSLAALIATAPLSAYYFGRLPLFSVVANLFVIPLVGLLIASGYLACVLAAVFYPLGDLVAQTTWLIAHFLLWIVGSFADIPGTELFVRRPPLGFFLIYATMVASLASPFRSRLQRKLALASLVMIGSVVWLDALGVKKELHVTVMDVGQGDAILLRFPNSRTLLIDCGDVYEDFDYGRDVIAPFLRRQGIDHLDAILITHPHRDHIGGLKGLLQSVSCDRLIHSGLVGDSLFWPIERSLNSHIVQCGDTLHFDSNCLCLVLHPDSGSVHLARNDAAQMNDASVVLKIIFKQSALLLTGDAESKAELKMIRFDHLLNAQIVKVGHHGSETASSIEFVKHVRAEKALISVAKFNRFGLPDPITIDRWQNHHAEVICTYDTGAIQFYSDGGTWYP
ncbi:DNA internalization-related competence protein ComEC/Rec2 [candidate division KSB1 bacterium]|nr:DNA internalization-related competence protein ComEC/Rec2 [candidate division KSB1 bacterium]